jgi:pimeloyl-ACP methyl ester carboxylesterase
VPFVGHSPHTIEVEGCPIHYIEWGEPTRPGIVLVHGGAAHAEWWSFIAPLLARRCHPTKYANSYFVFTHSE